MNILLIQECVYHLRKFHKWRICQYMWMWKVTYWIYQVMVVSVQLNGKRNKWIYQCMAVWVNVNEKRNMWIYQCMTMLVYVNVKRNMWIYQCMAVSVHVNVKRKMWIFQSINVYDERVIQLGMCNTILICPQATCIANTWMCSQDWNVSARCGWVQFIY